jgi:tetratricopeptide (TPR) repeat protein
VWGIRLGRYDYYGSGLWSYAQVLRLWRNRPEVRYEDMPIHSTVSTTLLRAGGKMVCLDNAMQHLDALLPARHVPKRSRYLELSRELVEKYPWLLCYIGLEHATRGEVEDARRSYEAAIKKSNSQEDSIRYFSHLLLGKLWLSLGDLKGAKDNLSVTLSRGPAANFYHQACVAAAEVALREGQIAQAVSLCRTGLEAPPFPAQTHLNLAALAELEGNQEEADTRVEYAIAVNRYLMNDEIYKPIRREHKTVYELQPALLSIVDTERLVMEHLERRGRTKEAGRWRAHA